MENPVTGERSTILELPWQNPEGRGVGELTALPGARVVGDHLHPTLHEHFSALEGELTMLRDGQRSVLHAGESRPHRSRGIARLVERSSDGRRRARRSHAGRAICAHDRDAVRPRA